MKKLKWLALVVAIMITPQLYSQVKDKDAMIKRIFEVFKNKDEDGFVKLFPDAAKMKEMMRAILGQGESEEDKQMMEQMMKEMSDSSIQQEFRDDFQRYLRKGEAKGIDWSKTKLVSFSSEIDSVKMREESMGTESLKGKIYFNVDQKEYFLSYSEIIRFQDTWYGVSIKRVDEKSKENMPDKTEFDDETSMMLDSAAGIPYPDTLATMITPSAPIKEPVKTTTKEKPKPAKAKPADPKRKP